MSVIIKGMKMPNSCEECNFDSPSGYCRAMPHNFCGTTNWECEGKPTWCPLIEIPPHGDLIDRDALRTNKYEFDGLTKSFYIDMKQIENAPTIIEAEEKG